MPPAEILFNLVREEINMKSYEQIEKEVQEKFETTMSDKTSFFNMKRLKERYNSIVNSIKLIERMGEDIGEEVNIFFGKIFMEILIQILEHCVTSSEKIPEELYKLFINGVLKDIFFIAPIRVRGPLVKGKGSIDMVCLFMEEEQKALSILLRKDLKGLKLAVYSYTDVEDENTWKAEENVKEVEMQKGFDEDSDSFIKMVQTSLVMSTWITERFCDYLSVTMAGNSNNTLN